MATDTRVRPVGGSSRGRAPAAEPCTVVIFGASGDLTRRLLMPAFYNLVCDGLLPERCAIIGMSRDPQGTERFRERMTEDIRKFSTRQTFDESAWEGLVSRLHYMGGSFDDPEAYKRLAVMVAELDAQNQAGGNVLFYMATPPAVFGLVSDQLARSGLKDRGAGWSRIIVEKPFGHDLASAVELNRELLAHWDEDQIYRIDHYLGKETVQNILAFRFSNGIYEHLWNKDHIDHIQFTVSETVGVEGRGKYYDQTGVLRDMMQNHMFQMLAYLCMEPPTSFKADAVRDEKARLLDAIRVMDAAQVAKNTARGQYGPGRKADGTPAVGYREEKDVNPASATETFAAVKLNIDNKRWEGVPVYLRSGKALWKRGTEIIVQFKKVPEEIFRDTPTVTHLEPNRLLFHIQPDQGIEFRFHAKSPGPLMALQNVNMRFDYREAFEASRGTGYEVMLYSCMIGDATLFSRTDLVESAWKVAQPVLDAWAASTPKDFPNYPAGSWGPKAAFDLMARDGRHWVEVITPATLERVPLFQGAGPVFLRNLAMTLEPVVYEAGETIIRQGETGREMYFLCRGQVEAFDDKGKVLSTLGDGAFFGEISLLREQPRSASVRAVTPCDLFVLDKADFDRALEQYPQFASAIREIVATRYPA